MVANREWPSVPLTARMDALHERRGRTGRAFFNDGELTTEILRRLAFAVDTAGLFDELRSEWVLLDAELLPWSAKAGDLIRNQYAVGAAARAAVPAAVNVLEQAAGRGLDVGDLLTVQRERSADAVAFTEAYRRVGRCNRARRDG